MQKATILWVDDEVNLLKPHILFLEQRNYSVHTCESGAEALEEIVKNDYDIIFLDENMPGLSGLETLQEIKEVKSLVPVVMITKSEEEFIMDDAVGSKIADYLIKPVNPNQILLSLKKNLDKNRLVSEKTTTNYRQEFRKIAMDLAAVNTIDEWVSLYQKLIFWELELENIEDDSMAEILESQKQEANSQFFKFVERNYPDWFDAKGEHPVMSHTVFKDYALPVIKEGQPVLMVVIDNLRYDQWKIIEPILSQGYKKVEEKPFFSILPTATQYARNAMFSGLMPLDIEKLYPEYWKNDVDEGGKNLYESELLTHQLKRLGLSLKHSYTKVTNLHYAKKFAEKFTENKDQDLTVLVYNFVDMLSHAKTETEVIKELVSDDKAYRSLTLSWFKNSPLLDIINQAKKLGFTLIITTDHGTINVKNPTKVVGDRETSLNLRYKTGRSLTYESKDVFAVKNPKDIRLPATNVSSSYIFAKTDMFLAYPNNYNHYVNYFRNSYQHGGISLEEMIIPFVVMKPR